MTHAITPEQLRERCVGATPSGWRCDLVPSETPCLFHRVAAQLASAERDKAHLHEEVERLTDCIDAGEKIQTTGGKVSPALVLLGGLRDEMRRRKAAERALREIREKVVEPMNQRIARLEKPLGRISYSGEYEAYQVAGMLEEHRDELESILSALPGSGVIREGRDEQKTQGSSGSPQSPVTDTEAL